MNQKVSFPKSLKLSLFSVFIFTFLSNCGESPSSKLNYAHRPAEQLAQSVLGMIEMPYIGITSDFDQIEVCVQNGSGTIKNNELLLETQLAFAYWLYAAGYSEEEWDRFKFEQSSHCGITDARYSSVVKLVKDSEPNPKLNPIANFGKSNLNCNKQPSGRYDCSYSQRELGRGEGASIALVESESGGRTTWSEVEIVNPSRSILSKNVEWVSIVEDIKMRQDMSSSEKNGFETLKNLYGNLLPHSSKSYESLITLVEHLERYQFNSAGDLNLRIHTRRFESSNSRTLEVDYKSKHGAFGYLLHEIGHQLGMDHADAPITNQAHTAGNSITGGQSVSSDTRMSDSNVFLFLDDDSRSGVKNARRMVRSFLRSVL